MTDIPIKLCLFEFWSLMEQNTVKIILDVYFMNPVPL